MIGGGLVHQASRSRLNFQALAKVCLVVALCSLPFQAGCCLELSFWRQPSFILISCPHPDSQRERQQISRENRYRRHHWQSEADWVVRESSWVPASGSAVGQCSVAGLV
jgi:hypothetical protein